MVETRRPRLEQPGDADAGGVSPVAVTVGAPGAPPALADDEPVDAATGSDDG